MSRDTADIPAGGRGRWWSLSSIVVWLSVAIGFPVVMALSGDDPVTLVREAWLEPSASRVIVVPALSLDVRTNHRQKSRGGSYSWLSASYTFELNGQVHSGTRVFPSREPDLRMRHKTANAVEIAIVTAYAVRVPDRDPERAFLAYRTRELWLRSAGWNGLFTLMWLACVCFGIRDFRAAMKRRRLQGRSDAPLASQWKNHNGKSDREGHKDRFG